MDIAQLKSLGEIAGIGGIALGVLVLLVRPLIGTISGLPKSARAGTVNLIAIGCFAIGVLGIAAWVIGNRAPGSEVSTKGSQSPGIIGGGDVSVSFGPSPPVQPAAPSGIPVTGTAPTGTAHTEGAQSPGIISGGKARVEYPSASPPNTK